MALSGLEPVISGVKTTGDDVGDWVQVGERGQQRGAGKIELGALSCSRLGELRLQDDE